MNTQFSDTVIQERIRVFEKAIERWAISNHIWHDCGFQSWSQRVDGEPTSPAVATIAYFSGDFSRMLDEEDPELYQQFKKIEEEHGFWHERWDGVSIYFYAEEDSPLVEPIADYMRWQWICGLLRPDFDDVHDEIYGHFNKHPDDIHKLSGREFEILVEGVLRHQGFETKLGPGSGDGGIDIKLLQRDPLGDILTMVQVKRYSPNRKIGLEAVQALYGAADLEGVKNSLFVTSSSYLPSTKKWAARTSGRVKLAASEDVIRWCRDASDGVIQDKSRLVDPTNVIRLVGEARGKPGSKILHAHTGVTMTINSFALVLKETRHAALLMRLPAITVSGDIYGQVGTEAPLLDPSAPLILNDETVWRAKRSVKNGRVNYWDGNHLYTSWSGQPQQFNYLD